MKYKLSKNWVLREDRVKVKNNFLLFSINTKEKKFINESTFLLLKIFENEGVDIKVIDKLLKTLIITDKNNSIINKLIDEEILILDSNDTKVINTEYEKLVSKENIDKLKNKYSISLSTTPETAEIHFTNTCNLTCDYCAYSAEPKVCNIISGADWSSIFDELEKMKLYEVTLSGGELFLHPDIEYLLQDLSTRRFAVTIFTNGMLVEEKHIPYLKSKNVKVGLSVDGVDKKSHETYRGKNTLAKVLNTVNLFYKNDVYYYFSTTIHRMNWQNIEELIKYAIKYNARSIEIGKVAKVGRGEQKEEMFLSENEVNSFIANIINLKKKYSEMSISFGEIDMENTDITNKKDNYLGVFCSAGTTRLTIDPKGDVYPCVLCFGDEDFLIHNALNNKISDVWHNGNWPLVREPIHLMQLGKCGTCGNNRFCEVVNCRLSAYYSTSTKGNIYGSTPFCINS